MRIMNDEFSSAMVNAFVNSEHTYGFHPPACGEPLAALLEIFYYCFVCMFEMRIRVLNKSALARGDGLASSQKRFSYWFSVVTADVSKRHACFFYKQDFPKRC